MRNFFFSFFIAPILFFSFFSVVQAASVTFSPPNPTVTKGGNLSFSWSTTGLSVGSTCTGTGGDWDGSPAGSKPLSGDQVLTNIEKNVTYKLTCVDLSVSPPVSTAGQIVITVAPLFSCTTGGGTCKTIPPETCGGTQKTPSDCAGGAICCVLSAPLPAVTITLTGSPATEPVVAGKPAILSWNATGVDASNPTPCTGGWSDAPLAPTGGPVIIPNITAGSGYTIICTNQATGSGGTVVGAPHTGSASTPAVSDGTGMTPGAGVGTPTEGLVPCGTQRIEAVPGADYRAAAEDCNFAFLITLIKKIINFLIFVIAMPLAAISFAWAGWLYMSSAGNESNIKKAHEIFGNVVLGLCIALAAWLIVNAIVVGLGVLPKYNSLTGGTFGGA